MFLFQWDPGLAECKRKKLVWTQPNGNHLVMLSFIDDSMMGLPRYGLIQVTSTHMNAIQRDASIYVSIYWWTEDGYTSVAFSYRSIDTLMLLVLWSMAICYSLLKLLQMKEDESRFTEVFVPMTSGCGYSNIEITSSNGKSLSWYWVTSIKVRNTSMLTLMNGYHMDRWISK